METTQYKLRFLLFDWKSRANKAVILDFESYPSLKYAAEDVREAFKDGVYVGNEWYDNIISLEIKSMRSFFIEIGNGILLH